MNITKIVEDAIKEATENLSDCHVMTRYMENRISTFSKLFLSLTSSEHEENEGKINDAMVYDGDFDALKSLIGSIISARSERN